ncbi:MAG: DNA-directed RNA polymerase subunit beta [Candidatus Colwellbacteria bacterium]|jgi:DNA-directed RNA polymerase subunit beta|nr:DNA-directed RNA polymerase subunit beta [Candidatus Colwellbacteria bacterium]
MPKQKNKVFSSHPGSFIKEPDLVSIQTESFKWFTERGLKDLLKEVSPIIDYSGKEFELHFKDFYFDEPKFSIEEVKDKALTYEAPLRMTVELTNINTKKTISQEIYFGDFPIMTKRGTFIINGVERVIISQLVRSPGVYFVSTNVRGYKYFGAKIIPNRGAWVEFVTDSDGALQVKIDRHRKVPATSFLRIFGLETDEAIKATFNSEKELKHIEATLKKDSAKNLSDSYMEIYKRLRPGDLAAPDAAKSLIDSMFKRDDRYDLSEVGRFKINQRLGTEDSSSRLIEQKDIIRIVKEMISLNNNPDAKDDDIDHLGNRRVRAVGELLEMRMRLGFSRMRRIVQDRMSTLEKTTLTPVQLVNVRPLIASVRDFFATSSMSQFMDQVNPLTELEHKRRVSALGPGGLSKERAGFEVRDVHSSHYGRLCPIQTPEGQNIGLINYLSIFARTNKYGFIEAPYMKLDKGKITKDVVWLDAFEEEKHKIAHSGEDFDQKKGMLANKVVEVRYQGKPTNVPREEAEFIDVSPSEILSVGASLIPFLENDDAKRALMGSNMQKQAVPSVKPEIPLVGTGMEEKAAYDSGHVIIAEDDGVVQAVDASHIVILENGGKKKEYNLEKFRMTNQYIAFSYKPTVKIGDKVKKGSVIGDGPSTKDGVLALGQNLTVAFVSWEGANYEDAIIISEKVVQDDRYTSVHIEDFTCDVRDTKLGPEVTTPDIPNVSEDKLKNLDEEGIVRIGAEVLAGDILVGKISPKGEAELTSEERLLRAIFGEKARDVKDTSLTVPHGKSGRIVGVRIFDREKGDKLDPGVIRRIQVQVASLRNIQAGDKMAGRHGNKGVISQIRPVEDMPFLEDGTPVDIILNPLGVASRMNLGQILETHLGWAAQKLGYFAHTPALAGATEDQIREELKEAGIPEDGKVSLYDGRTGQLFNSKATVGQIYMIKLNHMVLDKVHMRSIGPYSLITQQPLGGKAQFGGQRFGEMEVWALEGYGASHTLQEMLTIKSDDVLGRSASYEAIVRGEKIKQPNIPATFNVMTSELKALGLNIELLSDGTEEDLEEKDQKEDQNG